MKRLLVLTTTLLIGFTSVAQDDKASAVLKQVEAKTKDYKTVTATFTKKFTKGSAKSGPVKGDLKIKGDKYYINTGEGQKIYSDGRTVWTWLTGDGEVYKCPRDESEDIFDPSKLFSIWKEDFKYRYQGEETIGDHTYHVITLHPQKPGEKNFHTITLKIDKESHMVKYFIIKGKDQSTTEYRLDSITPNQEISNSRFRFLRSMCSDCDVIEC